MKVLPVFIRQLYRYSNLLLVPLSKEPYAQLNFEYIQTQHFSPISPILMNRKSPAVSIFEM